MPRALPKKIDRCYEPLVKGMKKYKIDTPLRAAHFIAQIGHETASFLYMEEIADGSGTKDEPTSATHSLATASASRARPHSADRPANYAAVQQGLRDRLRRTIRPRSRADPFACVDVACWYCTSADQSARRQGRRQGGHEGGERRLQRARRSMEYLYRSKAVLGIS
jgi:putative chitinase